MDMAMDMAKRTPEEWLQFITNERKTYNGANKYKYWMHLYRRAADSIPADEFAHNNNAYAKIMVDFAKLQARTSIDDARNIFQAARSNVKHCSVVYVAWAQFELLNNNPKKCKKLLAKGKQFCASPGYLLDMAMENFKNGNEQLIDDETEEHTFTELINKNTSSKTEDFSVLFLRTKHRTSDSSLESTSSSSGGVSSPEAAHSTFESFEESADDIVYKRKYSRSKYQLSREKSLSKISSSDDENVHNSASTGIIIDLTNDADAHSVYSNDDVRKQFNLPAFTMPVIAENDHATMKPTSNVTSSQLTTRSSAEDEVNIMCSITNVDHNGTRKQTEPVKEGVKEFNFAIPECSSTIKKVCSSSGSSESSDDIDAILLKKSLFNIGNKTGLMDFATPQNKSKGQVGETGTDRIIIDLTNDADVHSVYSNDDVRKHLNLPTFTMPIIAENDHATMKPTSNVTSSQLTTRSSAEDEVNIKCSIASVDHNATRKQTEPVKESVKEFNFAIPVCSSTIKKDCSSSGSSESSDDIDAISLKKSLFNIGNKTGLMDFATPQNKSKDQARETGTESNTVGGSMVKEQKSNARGKRSVFIGLPLRVPKSTKDEIEEKDGKRNGTSDKNGEIIQFHDKTKEKDAIDGVFAFPEENDTIDVQGTHVNTDQFLNTTKNKKLHNLSKSIRPHSNIYTEGISTQPSSSNKNHVDKMVEHDSEVNGESKFEVSNGEEYSYDNRVNKLNKCSGDQITRTINSTDGPLASSLDGSAAVVNLNQRAADNATTQQCSDSSQTISDLHQPSSLRKNAVDTVKNTPELVPSQHQLRNSPDPAAQGSNSSQECPKVCQSQKRNEATVSIDGGSVPHTTQTHKASGINFESGSSKHQSSDLSKKEKFSNNYSSHHHPTRTQMVDLNLREISAEINRVDPLSTSKLKPVTTTAPINTTGNRLHSTNSVYSQLDSSISAFQTSMQDISQITRQCSSSNRNITVNGKVYKKLNMIGRGGSSEVFTVFDADYAQYALKYVNVKDADASVVQSYVNEITLLKRLQGHESIIKLYDWELDEVNKVIKIVLERGSTDLAGYLKKHPGKITTDFIRMCWRNMLDAVDVIHKEGIIHSDLKPANFLVVELDLKLIDFGIANAIQGDVTSFYRDSTFGTLSYMSPEALKDISKSDDPNKQHKPLMKIGRPSDVWSLGCILYLMVYGKTPFQHIKNNFQKWSCIIDPSHEIKFPSIENQDLLDSMKGCLRRNPSERYTISQLQGHPFLTGRTSANDVDNVLNCIMQMQDINSPRTLRTFAKSLVGHLSSGGSLNTVSMQSCHNSKEN